MNTPSSTGPRKRGGGTGAGARGRSPSAAVDQEDVSEQAASVLVSRHNRKNKRRGLTPLLRVAPVLISRGKGAMELVPSQDTMREAVELMMTTAIWALPAGAPPPTTARGAVQSSPTPPPSTFSPYETRIPATLSDRALSDAELEEWRLKLRAKASSPGKYPANRFKGRGIVLSAGRRSYFTSAYVTIRALRGHLKCTLPIEVFYCGADELPSSAIAHMEKAYQVKFVDVTMVPGAKGVNLAGYQLKAFAIRLSSFEEVLWLDSDNIPLRDPSYLFDAEPYASTGALFWKDYCNMISFRKETFGVFGLPEPQDYVQPRPNKTTIWQHHCAAEIETELETGQVLLHKEKAWPALQMIVYINRHHQFFLKRLFKGDKMTFHFGFVAAGLQYGLVSQAPAAVGLTTEHLGDKRWFCGNTMAQRDPSDGSFLFLHRTMSKYKDVESFTKRQGTYRAWKYVAQQPARDPWHLMYRDELPPALFVGKSAGDQYECARPTGARVQLERAPGAMTKLETALLGYLDDLENLPFYPKDRVCNADSMFFCTHA